MDGEILRTVGGDPLSELVEMDHFYGWTRRIAKLSAIYMKKPSNVPYFMIGGLCAASLACGGLVIYLLFAG
ncbi:MAG: hypothetical protein ACMUHB_06400 [Thermoplasmatota archaeon]